MLLDIRNSIAAAAHDHAYSLRAFDTFLASPVLGAGVAVNLIDRIFLGATHGKGEAIARAHGAIATGGLKLHKVGQVLESDADIEAHIQDRAQFFFAEFLPYLRLLGVTG